MSKFKNSFPTKLSTKKRSLLPEFPNLIKTYEIYAYIAFSASLEISVFVQGVDIQKFSTYSRLKFVTFHIVRIVSRFQS